MDSSSLVVSHRKKDNVNVREECELIFPGVVSAGVSEAHTFFTGLKYFVRCNCQVGGNLKFQFQLQVEPIYF